MNLFFQFLFYQAHLKFQLYNQHNQLVLWHHILSLVAIYFLIINPDKYIGRMVFMSIEVGNIGLHTTHIAIKYLNDLFIK